MSSFSKWTTSSPCIAALLKFLCFQLHVQILLKELLKWCLFYFFLAILYCSKAWIIVNDSLNLFSVRAISSIFQLKQSIKFVFLCFVLSLHTSAFSSGIFDGKKLYWSESASVVNGWMVEKRFEHSKAFTLYAYRSIVQSFCTFSMVCFRLDITLLYRYSYLRYTAGGLPTLSEFFDVSGWWLIHS